MVRAPLFVPIYFNKMPFYNKRFLSGNPDMLYWKGAEEKQARGERESARKNRKKSKRA